MSNDQQKKNRLKNYAVPVLLTVLFFVAGIFYVEDTHKRVSPAEIVTLPHDRVLYVVCEQEGAYIGEEFVSFPGFEQFVKEHKTDLNPDYVIVAGTPDSRYGDVAAVFTALHRITGSPGTIETQPVPSGTRRPAVAILEHSRQD